MKRRASYDELRRVDDLLRAAAHAEPRVAATLRRIAGGEIVGRGGGLSRGGGTKGPRSPATLPCGDRAPMPTSTGDGGPKRDAAPERRRMKQPELFTEA